MPLRPATTLWPPVLLGSQFVFNIGFYAVVPFLAIFLRDDMLLSGGLIGLILGLRTFSQQGMFIVGGALSDRFGAKIVILSGCIIRVAGYLLLALGESLWPIILGACLTGWAALFSPSIEALLAKAGTHSEAKGKRSRAEWLRSLRSAGNSVRYWARLPAPCSPAWLSPGGAGGCWRLCHCAGGALLLPARVRHRADAEKQPWWTTFRQPRFVAFIIAYSSWL
jgi:MFS family permease